ncbi:hypothetical protein [Campylobacter sp. CCS1377]|uniref:Periplasmic protein n=1 Tax=Campylobacter sp. CCS1377 TaxID=3158229 RepID=A0AAU7E5N3_9BACT
MKKLTILSLLSLWLFAFDAYDDDLNNYNIDIDSGGDVSVYDYKSNEFKDYELEKIKPNGEIELFDYKNGEFKTLYKD